MKIRRGSIRSATPDIAVVMVPVTKPIATMLDVKPIHALEIPNSIASRGITAVAENHVLSAMVVATVNKMIERHLLL